MSVAQFDTRASDAVRAEIDRRKERASPQVQAEINRRKVRLAEVVKPEEIETWRARFPVAGSDLTDNAVEGLIRFQRDHPRTKSMMEFIPNSPTALSVLGSGPQQIAAGFQQWFWNAESNIAQGYAAIADTFQKPDLADEFRQSSRKILEYHESTRLGQVKGAGVGIGELAGNVAPSAFSLLATGGASAPVLLFYGMQAFGAGAQEYDQVMQAQGQLPDAIDRFAIASGYAVVEVAAEKIGLDVIGTRIGPKLARDLGDAMLKGKTRRTATLLFEANLVTDVEGVEELLTQFSQNAIAKKGIPGLVDGFDPERSLSEGLFEAWWKGKAAGAMLIGPAATVRVAPPRQRFDVPTAEQVDQRADVLPAARRRPPPPAGPVVPPPIIATEKPAEAAPEVVDEVAELDAQGLTTLEEAALDVLFDETAAVEAQQRAAEIVEEIDRRGIPAEETQAPTAAQKAEFLQRLGIDKKRTDEPTVTERQALRASLAAQKRVAEIVATQVRQEVQAAQKAKENVGKDTRVKVRRLVRATIAREQQGKFLRAVESATPARLTRILSDVELAIEQDNVSDMLRDVRKLQKRMRKQRRISEAVRKEAQEGLTQVEELLKPDNFASIKGNAAKLGAMRKALEFSLEIGDRVAADVATELAQNVSLIRGRLKNTAEAVKQVIASINATTAGPLSSDKATGIFGKFKVATGDNRNLTRLTENKGDDTGILEALLWREMTRAHGTYLGQVRDRIGQLEQASQRAGFKSFSDALAQLSGHGGKALTQTIEVEIGGSTVTLTMGQAMWFVAADIETHALLVAGTPVVTREGTKQEGVIVTQEEIAAIRAKVPRKLRDLITEAKAITQQDTTELMAALLELNGREPRRVQDYFRRRRNIRQAEKRGLPRSFRDAMVQYNENLGFTKERERGTGTPLIIEDFLTAIMGTVNDTAKVIHVAKPTRDASGVLLNPEVQTAINQRYGNDMNDALETHLGAASLAGTRQDVIAKFIRWLNANVAVGKLGLNPSSMLRQLGGIPRLAPIVGADVMADGIRGWIGVSMADLTSAPGRGFFWDRYISNITSRFGPVEADATFGTSQSAFGAGIDGALQSFVAGDLVTAYKRLRDTGLSTLEILNAFDAVNARIAYAGYLAKAKRDHPEWSEAKQRDWAIEKAEDAIRETQNSSSVLDLSTVALKARGKWWSTFLLFSSDRFKTQNRARRAHGEGTQQLMEVLAAEALNIIWSRAAGAGTSLFVALVVATAIGDEDDREDAIDRALEIDRNTIAMAIETVGVIDPIILPRILEATFYQRSGIFDSAVGSSLNDMVDAGKELSKAITKAPEESTEKTISRVLKGFRDIGLEAALLSGLNPLDAMVRRIVSSFDKLEDDEQEKVLVR